MPCCSADPENVGIADCLQQHGIPAFYEAVKDRVSVADYLVIIAEAATAAINGAATGAVARSPLEPSSAAYTPLLTTEAAGQEGAMHVERRVVHGPAVFMPDANEWLHTFSWHGSTTDGKGSKTSTLGDEKRPHALSFQKQRETCASCSPTLAPPGRTARAACTSGARPSAPRTS